MSWDVYEERLRLEMLDIIEGLLAMPHDGKYHVERVQKTIDKLWLATAAYRAAVVAHAGYNRMMAL